MQPTALPAQPGLETRFVGPEGHHLVHRVKTWSTGSRFRNGSFEPPSFHGILRKSERGDDTGVVWMSLARLSLRLAAQVAGTILERFSQAGDRSRFGLMNSVTSVARDTADPEVRWRLEEMGGGICACLTPVLEPDD